MDQSSDEKPVKAPGKAGAAAPLSSAARKAERLRDALRANLTRRKAQARGRADADTAKGGSSG